MHRVAEQLAVGYVFGDKNWSSLVLFATNECGNFFPRNQVLDFPLDDMGSIPIIIQNIDVWYQKQLVALRFCVLFPWFGHLLEAAHAFDFDEDAFFGTEKVELTATVLVVLDEFHAHTFVLDDVPYIVFAQFFQIDTVGEAGAALNHTLVNHALEGFFFAGNTYVKQELAPEAAVNQVTSGMFGTADIKVHVLPIVIGFAADIFFVVMRVLVA